MRLVERYARRALVMRAWYLTGKGVSGLTLRDVNYQKPGPGEVAVKVEAASLNFRDLIIAGPLGTSDRIPLSDGAGQIIAVGAGVNSVALGERVAACFFPFWLDGNLQ
jgi:NADPH:quinone reductase-like Zn-dependent oxidoreductase